MFLMLLVVTLLVSAGVAFATARMFERPLGAILARIIADDISDAWLKYLRFAIYVVGISKGVRVHELERYVMPSRYERDAGIVALTGDRWVLEIYRTIIETLQGIAWMLLVFFIFALIAYVIVRAFELRRKAPPGES